MYYIIDKITETKLTRPFKTLQEAKQWFTKLNTVGIFHLCNISKTEKIDTAKNTLRILDIDTNEITNPNSSKGLSHIQEVIPNLGKTKDNSFIKKHPKTLIIRGDHPKELKQWQKQLSRKLKKT